MSMNKSFLIIIITVTVSFSIIIFYCFLFSDKNLERRSRRSLFICQTHNFLQHKLYFKSCSTFRAKKSTLIELNGVTQTSEENVKNRNISQNNGSLILITGRDEQKYKWGYCSSH